MSEAHEKTRIRQLTDAAAHWEHKYANARQYNRNLEDRNKELEAQLERCRAANVYDGNAHRRVSEIETELAISKGREEGKQLVIDQLEATLKEAELQRDSWKRIAESGLDIPQAETFAEPIDQAPIARVIVHGDLPAEVLMYAPGLPVGEHDLYCEPITKGDAT